MTCRPEQGESSLEFLASQNMFRMTCRPEQGEGSFCLTYETLTDVHSVRGGVF